MTLVSIEEGVSVRLQQSQARLDHLLHQARHDDWILHQPVAISSRSLGTAATIAYAAGVRGRIARVASACTGGCQHHRLPGAAFTVRLTLLQRYR